MVLYIQRQWIPDSSSPTDWTEEAWDLSRQLLRSIQMTCISVLFFLIAAPATHATAGCGIVTLCTFQPVCFPLPVCLCIYARREAAQLRPRHN